MSERPESPQPATPAASTTSRRGFIRNSSLMAAGAVAGVAVAGQLNVARAAHAFGDETIRIGLVGCGGRGTGAAIQALNTAGPVKLVAMGDAFSDRVQAAYRSVHGQHADKVDVPEERRFVGFDAYQHVLNQEIDLVILATPPGFRPLHFEAAVAAGVHVFMEKPVAVDAAGVRKVLEASREAKKKDLAVAVGLQRRHEERYRETIKRLQDGAIGDIDLMRVYWNGAGVWVRPRQANQTEMEYQMRNWYYFNWLCGDHIVEQHIHNLDVGNWLKQGYPVWAQGMGGRQVRTGNEYGEIYDHFAVEFHYADGSVMLSNCRHIGNCWNSVSEHCHGSNGSCDIGGARISDRSGKQIWSFGRGGGGGHQEEHHHLFADLRAGRRPNEGEYGALSTMTSIMGRMVTYSGQALSWEQALNSELVLSPVDMYSSFSDAPPVKPNASGGYDIPMPGKYKAV